MVSSAQEIQRTLNPQRNPPHVLLIVADNLEILVMYRSVFEELHTNI